MLSRFILLCLGGSHLPMCAFSVSWFGFLFPFYGVCFLTFILVTFFCIICFLLLFSLTGKWLVFSLEYCYSRAPFKHKITVKCELIWGGLVLVVAETERWPETKCTLPLESVPEETTEVRGPPSQSWLYHQPALFNLGSGSQILCEKHIKWSLTGSTQS